MWATEWKEKSLQELVRPSPLLGCRDYLLDISRHVSVVDSTCGLAEALENDETPAKSTPATSSCGNVSFATLH